MLNNTLYIKELFYEKTVAMLLCLIFVFSFAGCKPNKTDYSSNYNVQNDSPALENSFVAESSSSKNDSSAESAFSKPHGATSATSSNPKKNNSSQSSIPSANGPSSNIQNNQTTEVKKLNYDFKNTISKEVLNNYLSKAITYGVFTDNQPWGQACDEAETTECLRALYNVGAKLVARAGGWWSYSAQGEAAFGSQKQWIEKAHKVDPDIVFEGCIFETCSENFNQITVPEHVQNTFGLTYDPNRKFNCEKMLFPDGYGKEMWSKTLHCPDITQTETQMYYYYAATKFIDAGYEALHLGQVMVTGKNDTDNKCWASVVEKIRSYAKTHARRGYVFINGHVPTHMWLDGKVSIGDYAAYPLRLRPAAGETDHMPTINNPQRAEIGIGYLYSLYGTNGAAVSPSGWSAENYPYLVEFDNWSTNVSQLGLVNSSGIWGTDEISWFYNQPATYRRQFLKDLVKQIDGFNENGHVALPGKRTAFNYIAKRQMVYYMNSADKHKSGLNDEETIKSIFNN